MKIHATPLTGVTLLEAEPFIDERGSFSRLFCTRELADVLGDRSIAQINHSRTVVAGAVRGLHYQHPPHAEMKIVRCLKGRVWDVAVDVRKGSPTFLQWHGQELSPENNMAMVIPEGCAHGFQVLEPGSELLYLHTAFYHRESEGGLHYNDTRLNIRWPLPVADLSERDRLHPLLDARFNGMAI